VHLLVTVQNKVKITYDIHYLFEDLKW
jgi:hypothetical protein